MKNLPCILVISTIASLVLVTVASLLGASFPYGLVVLDIAGFSTAGGVLALFLSDYAPSSTLASPVTEKKLAAKSIGVLQRRTVRESSRSLRGAIMPEDVTLLGLRNNPATLSVM